MKKIAEFVSLGHPDKVADYISQYLLDRYIEKDPATRYAVEVQIKDHHVTLGGEVSSKCLFTQSEINQFVRAAVNEIGYTRHYQLRWGVNNTIAGDLLTVTQHISQQSHDIAQGLEGWGDQGIFFGYATPEIDGMPVEHAIAKRLCKTLFTSGVGGLDIKTQIVMEDDIVSKVIVAIPLQDPEGEQKVRDYIVKNVADERAEIIINGTGRYVKHSSIADCGTTGRKLAVDFYGGACRIGGGSPWTKDGSKADLALNLLARKMAKQYARETKQEVFVSLACCIGKKEVDVSVSNAQDDILYEGVQVISPAELIKSLKLDTPIFASMCRWGLFGIYQADKEWEK